MTSLLYIYRSNLKGVTTVQTSYKQGDWLYFRCRKNGQLVGTSLRRCLSGSWSGTPPVCIGTSKCSVDTIRVIYTSENKARL